MEVELYLQGNISQEAVQDMFTRALAVAVGVPLEFVVKLTASEINEASDPRRRLTDNQTNQANQTNQTDLQDNQTKVYAVAYEIIVPEYMDADEIIDKANRIAEPGSAESQLFRQVLLETDGVVGVGKIVAKVSAYKVGDQATTVAPNEDEDDDEIWKPLLIGLSVAFVVIACLVFSAILIKIKMFPGETGNSYIPYSINAHGGPISGDVEDGRLEKVVRDVPRAESAVKESPAPQAVKESPAPAPQTVKESPAPAPLPVISLTAEDTVKGASQEGPKLISQAKPGKTVSEVQGDSTDLVDLVIPARSGILHL